MLNPKIGEDERIISRGRRCPDPFKPNRTDNARVLGQVRVVIPNESGVPDLLICNDKRDDQ